MQKELVKCAAGNSLRKRVEGKAKWPELETQLYNDFVQKREQGEIVRRGWFRITSKNYFQQLYLQTTGEDNLDLDEFIFSLGWFTNFLARFHISIRFTTNRAQKIPRDYLILILGFFQFI
jgi:hypothetical protein